MQFFEEQDFLVRRVNDSRVDGWCSARNRGRPEARISLVLMFRSHVAMELLY